jgi:hypothetical protein
MRASRGKPFDKRLQTLGRENESAIAKRWRKADAPDPDKL